MFSKRENKWATNDGTVSGVWRNNSNLSNSEQGASGLDPLGKNSPSRISHDRTVIATGTRNIAALAAKKRSKAHNDLLNLERQFGGEPRALGATNLTQTSLANHDRKYGDSMLPTIKSTSDDNLDNVSTGTKNSVNTDSTLPPLRENRFGKGDNRRVKRGGRYDYNYSQTVSNKSDSFTSNKEILNTH